jgi:hypothetical protein
VGVDEGAVDNIQMKLITFCVHRRTFVHTTCLIVLEIGCSSLPEAQTGESEGRAGEIAIQSMLVFAFFKVCRKL